MNDEIFEEMLQHTAFVYDDMETGESIPVPFGELIRDAKKQHAKIDSLEDELKTIRSIIYNIELTLEHGDGEKFSNIWRLIQPVIDQDGSES